VVIKGDWSEEGKRKTGNGILNYPITQLTIIQSIPVIPLIPVIPWKVIDVTGGD
jgi:hypothetical protein